MIGLHLTSVSLVRFEEKRTHIQQGGDFHDALVKTRVIENVCFRNGWLTSWIKVWPLKTTMEFKRDITKKCI